MKLAVILPVGPLDRYGYQYNHGIIVANLCAFATRVYMCSSTRNRAHVDELLSRFGNLEYVSHEGIWLELDAGGNEVFDSARVSLPSRAGTQKAAADNMDVALNIHINQYVPELAADPLKAYCRRIVEAGRPYGWLYKRYQLRDRLFHADTRVPWINNLHMAGQYRIAADSLVFKDGSVVTIGSGDFRRKDRVAIVDCPMELTLKDLEEVRNFTRCYADLKPGTSQVWNPAEGLQYYQEKMNQKLISKDSLDRTGAAIANNCRPDFISRQLLDNYACSWGKGAIVKGAIKGLFGRAKDIIRLSQE